MTIFVICVGSSLLSKATDVTGQKSLKDKIKKAKGTKKLKEQDQKS